MFTKILDLSIELFDVDSGEQEGMRANPIELSHFVDFIKQNKLQTELFIIGYLHEVSSPTVVHKNIKSTNILRDPELNPHLSDSGLASYIPNVYQMTTLVSSSYRTLSLTDSEKVFKLPLTNLNA
ncbi:hypothetical protein JHK87_000693 [Glycine soja]|nr:hypothetical protein JHK87_000693 [Glycine soja]